MSHGQISPVTGALIPPQNRKEKDGNRSRASSKAVPLSDLVGVSFDMKPVMKMAQECYQYKSRTAQV